MTEHFTKAEIKRFAVSALPTSQLDAIAIHGAACQTCHQLLVEILRRQKGTDGIQFSLDPTFLFRHDHLDYDQLVAIADNKPDATQQEITDIHLSTCAMCREDVRSFLAFRKEIEPELRVRYGPATDKPSDGPISAWHSWRRLVWKRAYIAAMIVIAIGLLVAVLYTRRKAGNLEARQTPPSRITTGATATPTPESQAANELLSPAPAISEQAPQRAPSPALVVRNREKLTPGNAGTIAVVNDGQGTVTVDKAGNVSGLQQISQDARQEIAEALTTESIKAPETVMELAGAPIKLRGPDNTPTFKLFSPGREVVLSDRPSFAWEKLAGTSSYRVVIGDLKGHEVTSSEELSADRTTWTVPMPLKRGEIYTWEVEAAVDRKKIYSPGTSQTQMKFMVLSDKRAAELEQLKKVNSHLALGLFYAREGMITDAEREFEILIRHNPNSAVVKKLLKQIQSWKP